MANWKDTLMSIAPTVATALGGPLAGVAVGAIGKVLGLDKSTTETVASLITSGKLTPDQLSELKKLELQYQNEEQERGFKYADLAFKDRDSARKANVEGGTQKLLFWLSLVLLTLSLGTEIIVLFWGYPSTLPEIIVGRVLGLMDAVAMMVLAYWYGTTHGSSQKNVLLAQSEPAK
ncbi:MAG: hypothetical protein A3J49_19340 [Gallionellales bacterium RIFCSPHIGHO2_02_FULL_57_16]|nr:MAG: hypothetical protein A3J49_19340 [Gallionellales bacterium RIFCSPHIGHO2_02_FULL_57_16]